MILDFCFQIVTSEPSQASSLLAISLNYNGVRSASIRYLPVPI